MKEIKWVNTGCGIQLSEFHENPRNPKVHTEEQIAHIRNSILTFGFLDPIGIWGSEAWVVEGHGRLEALRALVREKIVAVPDSGVPVIRLDHLTPQERDAYMVEHNQATMETPWDDTTLGELLSDLSQTMDMAELFGLNPDAADGAAMEDLIPPDGDGNGACDRYQLVIDCINEEDMQEKYNRLTAMEIPCRPLIN